MQAAQKLLATALSAKGMKQSSQIMNDLELVLRGDGPNPAMGRDPEMYYFTVFGTPGDKAAWGWRVEGHHLSQNFTIVERHLQLVDARLLRRKSGRGADRDRERGCACSRPKKTRRFALLRALNTSQREVAVLEDKVPGDMITTNSRRV